MSISTYDNGHVGLADRKLEKLWNVENSGESYNGNYVEFPDADFVTELENIRFNIKSYLNIRLLH